MRSVENRPVYSLVNPLDQPGGTEDGNRFILFTHGGGVMMSMRLACSRLVQVQDMIEVLDWKDNIIAKFSKEIPFQMIRRDFMVIEPYERYTDRAASEASLISTMDRNARVKYFGKKQVEAQEAAEEVMMPVGPDMTAGYL